MDRKKALELLKGPDGVKVWNGRLQDIRSDKFDFANADLTNAQLAGVNFSYLNFSGADLSHSDMTNSTLQRTDFSGAILAHAKLDSATMQGVDLRKAVLKQCDFSEAKLQSANLTGAQGDCNLSSAQLGEATLTHVSLDGGQLDHASLRKARVDGASLQRVSMKHANLDDAVFCGTDFSGADISGTTFIQADLSGADLTDVIVNSRTSFENARVDGCKIARHTLECLQDYGGLTPGQRMVMNIVDDVARLRASYSGFQQWAHLIALAVFVFPYAWFLVNSWTHAKFLSDDGESTITLIAALFRYISNGGQNLQDGLQINVYALSLFAIALTYNTVRAVLLWKTKRLELTQEASGLPAIFSLRGTWGVVFQIAHVGFFVNLFVVFLHTIYFLGQQIPIRVLP